MLAVNDRVGEYVLVEQIGAGAFGQVFKARHRLWPDRLVAAKVATDPDYARLIRREGLALHRVEHPNVVRVLGCDPYAEQPYLIMEYMAGGDLRQALDRGPLPVARAVAVLEQVLAGLSAVHAAGVIHLDVKPSNILFDGNGVARLSDFGLGRLPAGSEQSIAQSLSMARDAARIAGTLAYMPEEQREGRQVDARADLFATGVVLFEMLTGHRPSGIEKPSDLRPETPAWLDEVFLHSYARLERRYPSADAMLADLRARRTASLPAQVPDADAAAGPTEPGLRAFFPMTPEQAASVQRAAAGALGLPLRGELDCGGGVMLAVALIPGGEFLMGSPEDETDRIPDETQREVTIRKPFHMGIYAVMQEQYRQVMGANPSHFKGPRRPVETVSWADAAEFCWRLSAKTGKTVRLPTEAEWEYACRAGTSTPFSTGETISTDQANYDGSDTYGRCIKGEDRQQTVDAGSFEPNAWGLYDMHGNVWEWCWDWHGEQNIGKSSGDDPAGPGEGQPRVLRGGAWCYGPWFCRSAIRFRFQPDLRHLFVGFRVVVCDWGAG